MTDKARVETMRKSANDNISYWGGCPTCGGNDGCMTDSGGSHWYYCRTHRTKWCIGYSLCSNPEMSRQEFVVNDYRLRHYEVVEPVVAGCQEAPDQNEEFLANRKAAAQLIDPDTCDICVEYCNVNDPYGIRGIGFALDGCLTFVSSAESDGLVFVGDLSAGQRRTVYERIEGDVLHIECGDATSVDGRDKPPDD